MFWYHLHNVKECTPCFSHSRISRFESNLSLGSAGISSSPKPDTGFSHMSRCGWYHSRSGLITRPLTQTPTLSCQSDAAGTVLCFTVSHCAVVTGLHIVPMSNIQRHVDWPNIVQTPRTLFQIIVQIMTNTENIQWLKVIKQIYSYVYIHLFLTC